MKLSERQALKLMMLLQSTLNSDDYNRTLGGMSTDVRRKLYEEILNNHSDAPTTLDTVTMDVSKFNG